MSQARDESAAIDDLSALYDLLGAAALPPVVVAAALGPGRADLSSPDLAEVGRWRADGWLVATSTPATRSVVSPERRRAVVDRVVRALLDDLAVERDAGVRWVAEGTHRVVLAVARLASAEVRPSAAVSLLALLWAAPGAAGFEPDFAREAVDLGLDAASAARDPHALAGLLRAASRWSEARGDLARAEELASWEWEVWRRLDDLPEMAATLWRRAGMFAARRRGDRELGCYERLESLHRGEHARPRLARVLAAKGSAFLAYGRVPAAVDALQRAERMVRSLPDFPPVEQAAVLEWSGRALWASGEPGVARRRFFDALALLVDRDEPGADRVRDLLAHDRGAELPPAHPDRFPGARA
ncbi:hypothetical protein AB0I60_05910 [Actinosynnema sp. NPDC050436]|uniref:hypothetical protein n=1 Tax=Actinosynnema sp. NPDC050436 TaxID=3155659 RepID=UPI0033EDB519